MKRLIKWVFGKFGYQILSKNDISVKFADKSPNTIKLAEPGGTKRPVGNTTYFLEDLKARGFSPKMIVDIGANTGHWSIKAALTFPESKFHLLEPQIEMKHALEKACSENKNFSYSLVGVGSKKEELIFTVWDDLQGSSFTPTEDPELLKTGKQRKLPITTLNELLDTNVITIPDIVKIDIQGFELEAIKGASKLFDKTELFILETAFFPFGGKFPEFIEVVNFMRECGYSVYDFPNFSRRPYDGALGQSDVCFARTNGELRKFKNFAKK